MTESLQLAIFKILGTILSAAGILLLVSLPLTTYTGRSPAILSGETTGFFAATLGCALVVWGTALLAASKKPALAVLLARPTALGLFLLAAVRLFAFFSLEQIRGMVGFVPLIEAVVLSAMSVTFLRSRMGGPTSEVSRCSSTA